MDLIYIQNPEKEYSIDVYYYDGKGNRYGYYLDDISLELWRLPLCAMKTRALNRIIYRKKFGENNLERKQNRKAG